MDLASILGNFWHIFSIVFGIDPSTLEFEQFSIEFQLKINTLERWKFEFYSILSKKTEKWHVLILHAFRITLWIHFGIIFGTVWHEIPYFSAIVFPDVFLDVFLVALWANLGPNAPQNGSRISKQMRIVLSCSVRALQTPFRNNFGSISAAICSILEVIWDVLAIRWSSCSIDFSHLTLPKLLPHMKLSFS